jgi:hypothetical protein
MHLHTLVAAAIATTACLSAQNSDVGFVFNVGAGATTRGAATFHACQQIERFDFGDYRFWGSPGPTGNTVNGFKFILQDQFDTSVETYNLHIYGEDPVNPHFPNMQPAQPPGTNALVNAGPFNSPGGTAAGPAAWYITITFGTPVVLPNNTDVFAGVEFQQSAVNPNTNNPWPDDGLSVQINLGANPNFPPPTTNIYDLPGPGLIGGGVTNNSYGMAHDVLSSTFSYGGARQYLMDFQVAPGVTRGVATAITTQANYPLSNNPPGTASFFSGLHPSVVVRGDNVGYTFFGANSGELVFYLAGFNFQNPALPLTAFLPGATGMACLDITNNVVLGFNVASGTGTDSFGITFSAAQRPNVQGLNLVMQALALNPATGILRGGPCVMQRN